MLSWLLRHVVILTTLGKLTAAEKTNENLLFELLPGGWVWTTGKGAVKKEVEKNFQ